MWHAEKLRLYPTGQQSPTFLTSRTEAPMRILCLMIRGGAEVMMLALGNGCKHR